MIAKREKKGLSILRFLRNGARQSPGQSFTKAARRSRSKACQPPTPTAAAEPAPAARKLTPVMAYRPTDLPFVFLPNESWETRSPSDDLSLVAKVPAHRRACAELRLHRVGFAPGLSIYQTLAGESCRARRRDR